MTFDTQPLLENDKVVLYPLEPTDFDAVYAAASDPKVWEQHPNRDRWKKDVFQVFFEGALQSKGAFKIVDKSTGEVIGSTRIYDYDKADDSVKVGYTFYATRYWGKGVNPCVKALMFDYLFRFVSTIYLHVGATNFRSQIAVGRLGAQKVGEEDVRYFGEEPKLNFVYAVTREGWRSKGRPGN